MELTMGRRGGFSMVEILVVMVVGAVALAAIYRTLIVQQRSYQHEGARITTQQAARTAVNLLAAELQEISATGDDLRMIAPESLSVRVPRKLGIVCAASASANEITIWLLSTDRPFHDNDWVIGYVDGDPSTSSDDVWLRDQITGTASSGTCPDSWSSYPPRQLSFNDLGLADADVRTGAQIRGSVLFTYGLRNIDGEWVLARHDSDDTEWTVLVGPLASPEDGGLEFSYIDDTGADITPSTGNTVTDPATLRTIQQIEISAAARSRSRVNPDGTYYLDSLSLQLYLRNN